jgi:hypothetical protein
MFKKIKNISKKDISQTLSVGLLYTGLLIHFFDTDDALLYLQYSILGVSIALTIVTVPLRKSPKK